MNILAAFLFPHEVCYSSVTARCVLIEQNASLLLTLPSTIGTTSAHQMCLSCANTLGLPGCRKETVFLTFLLAKLLLGLERSTLCIRD